MKSSNPNCVQRVSNLLISTPNTFIRLPSPIQKISQPPGQDQQNARRTQYQTPPQFFRIKLKDKFLDFLDFFSQIRISHWLRKNFKIAESFSLTQLRQYSSLGSQHHPRLPKKREITHPIRKLVFRKSFPHQKSRRENYEDPTRKNCLIKVSLTFTIPSPYFSLPLSGQPSFFKNISNTTIIVKHHPPTRNIFCNHPSPNHIFYSTFFLIQIKRQRKNS